MVIKPIKKDTVSDNSFIVIIPARMSSTRLPGKPLKDICGIPMIVRVAQQSSLSMAKEVYIATDSEQICNTVNKYGFKSIMTSSNHESGTDRLSESVGILRLKNNEIIVNVQGDEPLIDPEVINSVAKKLKNSKLAHISTCAFKINNEKDMLNKNIVKVVCDLKNNALYFSRTSVPWNNQRYNDTYGYGHIGVYAYRSSFLKKYPFIKKGELEESESLEQLRALENGYKIIVEIINEELCPGVDTLEDLERTRDICNKKMQICCQ
ncbi:3-deoxy-manno-octulosonate cytidylyltransferase kdsB [Candidatus Kinetoplastibacterium blastocrithidii TCC012E]|uniref:3-deoxy-manno-octulosonate cytidylyltransferase n=1 Tax=Candidatus Kinetoplastidibacterium blastocrithidiae TCC012E TaxID=1208922 RepID=M1LVY8_9PROT|nr:3-deoxy-manno-octulosonate cytidylyltransferase [Candidatus Kinetoplastibacterium blastocrithidii]AGF49717.1 3-deoxy-manno-octulosonate cytidylyltransferase kdsB [Candidatus Kinetoplastibacterium blastocrithidii TCC012E]